MTRSSTLAAAQSPHVSQKAQRARCWLVDGGEVATLGL